MNAIFLKYKELLKQTPPLTAAEIEKKMMKDYGWTWQEIKLAQEYCTPPEKKNYWVDEKTAHDWTGWTDKFKSKEWPDCEPKQQWDHSIPVTNIRTPPPTPVPHQYCGASINEASAQDWDAVRPDIAEPNDATDPLKYQVGGDHYTKKKIQPVEYIHANEMDYMDGAIVKYISRWRDKDGVKDLRKIKQFVDLIIKMNKL